MRAEQLPEGIFLEILQHLDTADAKNFALACKPFKHAFLAKTACTDMVQQDVYSLDLPVPDYCKPSGVLSDLQRKLLTEHAVGLNQNLESKRTPSIFPLHDTGSVTWTRIIYGRWLLAAVSDRTNSVLKLWPLSAFTNPTQPVISHTLAYLQGPVCSGQVEIQNGEILIALELATAAFPSIEVLKLVLDNQRLALARLASYERISQLRTLHDCWVGFSVDGERSIPSLLNWKTGVVYNLFSSPALEGGTLAMALRPDVAVAVTPKNLHLFFVTHTGNVKEHVKHIRSVELAVSVGFADVKFVGTTTKDGMCGYELRICLAGEDGLYLYGIAEEDIHTPEVQMSAIWGLPRTPTGREAVPFCPTIDESGTVSWLQGHPKNPLDINSKDPLLPISFHTTTRRPLVDKDSLATTYELEDVELPAMYAMGVYHYDAGLGVAVFGNFYGELALVKFCDTSIHDLQACFEPIILKPMTNTKVLPTTPIEATFRLPFPYSGPRTVIADDDRDKMFNYWKSQPFFPHNPPSNWYWDALEIEDSDGDTCYAPWFPRLQPGAEDKAWALEHYFHFYGTPVPLMRHVNREVSIFYVGGLLFFMWQEDVWRSTVVSPDVDVGRLAAVLDAGMVPPGVDLRADKAALEWGYTTRPWIQELRNGRNRWAETEQRGGDVDSSWIDGAKRFLAPPLPD